MNRNRFLLIGATALAIGLLVSLWVYRKLQLHTGVREPDVEVMVAANDLQVGAKVEERDIRIVRVPLSVLPPGAPRQRADVIGRGVVIPVGKGQFILPFALAGENAGSGLPSLIPLGMRASSVPVNEVSGVSGFATPGTRVDVLMTGAVNGSEQQTVTVLQNVAVIATGRTIERSSNGEPQNTSTATLLTTLENAERLTLASTQGHIQLILRNPIDTRSQDISGVKLRELYKEINPAPKLTRAAHHILPVNSEIPAKPVLQEIEVIEGGQKSKVGCDRSGSC